MPQRLTYAHRIREAIPAGELLRVIESSEELENFSGAFEEEESGDSSES